MKRIAPDKWKHFYVGIGLGGVIQLLVEVLIFGNILWAAVLSLVLLIIGNYGFELFSKITGIGHYDFFDAVAGTVGGVLGMSIIILFQFIFTGSM
jgi:glycopeptide antibiotics resistance protein